MKHLSVTLFVLAAVVVCFGCTKSSTQSGSTPTQTAVSAPSATGLTVSFSDIAGFDGAQAIEDLGALGVLESTSGVFRPNDSITRAEFARWLVKAQNAIVEQQYHLRLASTGEKATFVDVSSSDPDFPYIQGLADAGFVVGVDPTHYAPTAPLTREQMIYVKAQVDEHSNIKTSGDESDVMNRFSDASQINRKYLGAIYEDGSAETTQTFSRVYGATKIFGPKDAVTRGDAAIALSAMRGEWNRTAAEALGRTPGP